MSYSMFEVYLRQVKNGHRRKPQFIIMSHEAYDIYEEVNKEEDRVYRVTDKQRLIEGIPLLILHSTGGTIFDYVL